MINVVWMAKITPIQIPYSTFFIIGWTWKAMCLAANSFPLHPGRTFAKRSRESDVSIHHPQAYQPITRFKVLALVTLPYDTSA
jgi:hypothetical protein